MRCEIPAALQYYHIATEFFSIIKALIGERMHLKRLINLMNQHGVYYMEAPPEARHRRYLDSSILCQSNY